MSDPEDARSHRRTTRLDARPDEHQPDTGAAPDPRINGPIAVRMPYHPGIALRVAGVVRHGVTPGQIPRAPGIDMNLGGGP
jgi:hypothetical protein